MLELNIIYTPGDGYEHQEMVDIESLDMVDEQDDILNYQHLGELLEMYVTDKETYERLYTYKSDKLVYNQ